jgi:hypothetical protein
MHSDFARGSSKSHIAALILPLTSLQGTACVRVTEELCLSDLALDVEIRGVWRLLW